LQVFAPESSRYIRIDQIRRLAEFLSQSPQVASGKVVIIDRADQLNVNAANALLKTLEEPVDDATLLLLHDEGLPLLPTVRSRCQVLALKTPGRAQAASWLSGQVKDRDDVTEQAVGAALDLAGGAPLLARDYLVDGLLSERERCLDALRAFLKREIPLMEAARPFVDAGLEKTLDFMAHWIHDMARLAHNVAGDDASARDMLTFLMRHNDPARAQALFELIREARAGLDYNLNPTLEVERLLMGWQAMMPGKRGAARA
jgi:DNA polymerase-3 subunit delta'